MPHALDSAVGKAVMKQGIAIPTYDVHKRCVWHVDNHVDVSNTLYMGCRRLIESNKREVGFADS